MFVAMGKGHSEIKNKTVDTGIYIVSKILLQLLLSENLIIRKEFERIDELNKISFNETAG